MAEPITETMTHFELGLKLYEYGFGEGTVTIERTRDIDGPDNTIYEIKSRRLGSIHHFISPLSEHGEKCWVEGLLNEELEVTYWCELTRIILGEDFVTALSPKELTLLAKATEEQKCRAFYFAKTGNHVEVEPY